MAANRSAMPFFLGPGGIRCLLRTPEVCLSARSAAPGATVGGLKLRGFIEGLLTFVVSRFATPIGTSGYHATFCNALSARLILISYDSIPAQILGRQMLRWYSIDLTGLPPYT
jgi:hypothetical protein